ncbi:hypothetical protein ACET3X_000110 [Alternaria dauci]|uniref:C2H2-type domain-containing protein n=1 Tax=Alternaria dauci TaxID=48095 RepID=A0ABR3UUL4_9PLEO
MKSTQLDQISQEPSDLQSEVDLTDYSLVSSATLSNEAGIDTAPSRHQSISSESTPITGTWSPPSNDGTADTEPSEFVPSVQHASSSVHQTDSSDAPRFVTPSFKDSHIRNEPRQCGYCDCTFNRACDLNTHCLSRERRPGKTPPKSSIARNPQSLPMPQTWLRKILPKKGQHAQAYGPQA